METTFKVWETSAINLSNWQVYVHCEFMLNGKIKRLTKSLESGGVFRKTGNINRDRVEETFWVEKHELSEIKPWIESDKIDILEDAKSMLNEV